MMRILVLFFALILPASAVAECVQVGPEICLPLNKYKVPINELPLYGLVQKTPEQRAADDKFVEDVLKAGTREQAITRALDSGWSALNRQDYVIAARRFNQAFLLDKADSRIYHAFAILVTLRWKDPEYAEQLFKLAKRFPNKYPALNADYGRLLLLMSRPKDALPLLEQAVKDSPKIQEAWANLAFARLDAGDKQGACAAIAEGLKLGGEPINRDAAIIKSKAECK